MSMADRSLRRVDQIRAGDRLQAYEGAYVGAHAQVPGRTAAARCVDSGPIWDLWAGRECWLRGGGGGAHDLQ